MRPEQNHTLLHDEWRHTHTHNSIVLCMPRIVHSSSSIHPFLFVFFYDIKKNCGVWTDVKRLVNPLIDSLNHMHILIFFCASDSISPKEIGMSSSEWGSNWATMTSYYENPTNSRLELGVRRTRSYSRRFIVHTKEFRQSIPRCLTYIVSVFHVKWSAIDSSVPRIQTHYSTYG